MKDFAGGWSIRWGSDLDDYQFSQAAEQAGT
jgi:hypothetical protein